MGLVENVLASRGRRGGWPVGAGSVLLGDKFHGHDLEQFAPDAEYGEYLATSNDVYSVVSARARLMSTLPLRFYKGRGNDKTVIDAGPAPDLYWKVNDFWTAERLERMDELAMGIWGHTAWAIEPGPRGEPDQIWWLKAGRLRPVPHEEDYLAGFLYEPVMGGQLIPFEPHEIVWFRYPNPLDEFAPLSPLAAARLAADTASAMMKANKNLFVNGLMAGGVIVPDTGNVTFSKEQAGELERQFATRMKGINNAHRWAVLRYEAKIQGLNVSPKDAQFTEGLNLTFRQVCRAYGMQSALLGDLEHSTLANATAFERLEWSRTLVPDSKLRAGEIREQYLPRFKARGTPNFCEYDYTGVPALQESASATWAREAQALDRGAITINEWRAKQGLPAVPWGDRPYMPVNKAPLNPDGTLDLPKPEPADPAEVGPAEVDPADLPDDEVNPANPAPQVSGEKWLDHHAARRLLAALGPINGARL